MKMELAEELLAAVQQNWMRVVEEDLLLKERRIRRKILLEARSISRIDRNDFLTRSPLLIGFAVFILSSYNSILQG